MATRCSDECRFPDVHDPRTKSGERADLFYREASPPTSRQADPELGLPVYALSRKVNSGSKTHLKRGSRGSRQMFSTCYMNTDRRSAASHQL